eukprot:GCRY01002197.1.p1 GENE.GCRY01002197.1~~GCRY01002197.1.p1  ORF type:complete len:163 (+),score=10.29 GCRY01002197.1:177-665(+)
MANPLYKILGKEEEKPKTWWQEVKDECKLTKTQRFYGFAICFIVGTLLTCMSTLFLRDLGKHPERFALSYTFGNIVAICSSMFLKGPVSQVKSMFKATRLTATLIFLVSMGLTLWAVFYFDPPKKGLVLLFIIIQLCAFLWYCLSYIPYARQCVKNCVESAV